MKTKPKRKLEPITSTLVVNWTKPEDDPIRHAEYCCAMAEMIDDCLVEIEQRKVAA